jgi:hypothetical protein
MSQPRSQSDPDVLVNQNLNDMLLIVKANGLVSRRKSIMGDARVGMVHW